MNQPEFEYLGPYRVERVLGRGGMGTVYKGVHARSGEKVAIKVIARGVANQPKFMRRFDDEAHTLQRLKHPNIVSLIGSGEEHGYLFYVMEYVDGHSLHEHLRMRTKLPWPDVIEIGIQTASALKHAHDLGIIHRDLKPANLMLNTSGNVKLTDFGIAKLFGSSDQTAAGTVIGTADFMPPEQAEGKTVTVRSDLYSLGAVLYALLCGRAPFTGKSVPEVLYAVRYMPVPSLEEFVADVPEELSELIHQLLEKDPLKRPPTGLVVCNRLKSLQQGLGNQHDLPNGDAGSRGIGDLASKIGAELTSLDLSDVDDDEELRLTGESPKAAATDADREVILPADPGLETDPSAPSEGTHEQATLAAPAPDSAHEDHTRAQDDADFKVGPDSIANGQVSVVPPSKEIASEMAPPDSPVSAMGRSHYTPVDGDATPRREPEEPATPGTDWLQYASIAALLGLLVICIALGVYLVQPRDASSVYRSVMEAANSGDDSQLLAAKGDIDEFLDRFPNDSRVGEVKLLSNEVDLTRWTRILKRRAALAGGQDNLSVIEQGFLECLDARSENSHIAEEKLQAFLDVCQASADSRDAQRLQELAQFALDTLHHQAVESSPAALELEALIREARSNLKPHQLEAFTNSIIRLYGDKPWAAAQIQQLRNEPTPES